MLVNNSNFRVKEIPNFHPELQYYDRIGFWKAEKRRCIEGHWQQGKWMPGPLYYYINFHNIQFEDPKSVSQAFGLPFLRDIDWELFLLYEECRGFSGFSEDTLNTCDRRYGPDKEVSIMLGFITKAEAEKKTYVNARDYLRKNHGKSLGKPLYQNDAQHFISIQARGSGKTYSTSGIAAHNYLFDGATDYDDYLARKQLKQYIASDTIIGAIDTKYSDNLAKKVKKAFELLPGGYKTHDGEEYPSPLFVDYKGSLAPNKELESLLSGSVLRHRTFKDNPLAGNGTRANLVALDEIGFMYNVKEAWGALEAIQASKEKKNLVIWALGTGGLVSGRAALYAESIFRNPQDYNCLIFEDIFENRGNIGYFVPYTKTLNQFKKNENMITDEVKSRAYVEHRRQKAKKSPDPSVYQTEIINGPVLPSEAFLILEGSYFPTLLLKEQLAEVEGGKYKKYTEASFKGRIRFDAQNMPEFEPIQDAVPIRKFPLGREEKKTGCVEIFVKPQKNEHGVIPYGTYIGGMDVVDKAKSTTDSLPSIFIMNRYTRQIVAEYTGRTDDPNDFYEICRRLLLYYNATGMYEQNLPGLFTYFEKHQCLYLLADTPYQLRNVDTYKEGSNTSKGINASGTVNSTARDYIKSWLNEKISTNSETRVYETLYSTALITELLMWNPDGNFDRCVLPDSLVLTKKGFIPIEKLSEKDSVVSKDGMLNKIYQTHKNIYKGDIYSIKAVGQLEPLGCTENHPVFVADISRKHTSQVSPFHTYTVGEVKEIRADKVQIGDYVLTSKRNSRKPLNVSSELKYVLGWMLGDGYIQNRDTYKQYCCKIYFQGDQLEICKNVEKIIYKNFGDYKSNRNKHLKTSCTIKKEGNMYKLIVASKPFYMFCKKYLNVSPDKKMSDVLFNATDMLPFLQGYFEADGHYEVGKCRRLTVTSSSKEEIYQIRQLLLDEGIWNTVSKSKSYKLTNGYIRKDAYTISVNNAKMNLIVQNSLKFLHKGLHTGKSTTRAIETKEGFWSKVVKITKKSYEGFVYNLGVENNPSYSANGLCTHNCSALGMLMWHDATMHRVTEKRHEEVKTFLNDPYFAKMGLHKDIVSSDNNGFMNFNS